MSSVSDETDIEGAEEGFIDKGVNWISEEENKCTCESDCNDNGICHHDLLRQYI